MYCIVHDIFESLRICCKRVFNCILSQSFTLAKTEFIAFIVFVELVGCPFTENKMLAKMCKLNMNSFQCYNLFFILSSFTYKGVRKGECWG